MHGDGFVTNIEQKNKSENVIRAERGKAVGEGRAADSRHRAHRGVCAYLCVCVRAHPQECLALRDGGCCVTSE